MQWNCLSGARKELGLLAFFPDQLNQNDWPHCVLVSRRFVMFFLSFYDRSRHTRALMIINSRNKGRI